MKVVIKEKEYDYFSDYPNGWLFASGDPYKFPVTIGKYTCFIKRFEKKRPDDISGWDLMVQLKGRFDPNLPRIYDVVEEEENGKLIHYVFYEFLAGETLEATVARNADLDLLRLTKDLFQAAEALHARRFWFSDFCEKNIFVDSTGRFLLIDLDSVQPQAQRPHNNMYGDKQYWALVLNFYKEQLNYKNLKPADISGSLLNYLQLVFLVLRLKIALVDKRYDYKATELYENLPGLLHDTDPGFDDIFKQALEESQHGQGMFSVDKVQEHIIQYIIQNSEVPYQPSQKLPQIFKFSADQTELNPGQPLDLTWEVAHTTHLELYRNAALHQQIPTNLTTLLAKENYDGRPKKVVYTLRAINNFGEINSEALTITISEQPDMIITETHQTTESKIDDQNLQVIENETEILPDEPFIEKQAEPKTTEPVISYFQATTAQAVGGQEFFLNWEVDYATHLILYRNNQVHATNLVSQQSLKITEEYSAAASTVTYFLEAKNNQATIKSNNLTIQIINPITPNPQKLWYIRLALFVFFLAMAAILAVLAYGVFFRKELKITALHGNLIEGETLAIVGKNFPKQVKHMQVFFNKQSGKIISLSPNSLRVLVPAVHTVTDSVPVRLAVLLKQDTLYTASNLFLKKQPLSPQQTPLVRTDPGVITKPDSLAVDTRESETDSVPSLHPDYGTNKPDGLDKPIYPRTNKKPYSLPKPDKPKPRPKRSTPNVPDSKKEPVRYAQSDRSAVDLYKLVSVKSNVVINQRREGTKNWQITVQNSSPYKLDNVRVELNYMRKNGKQLKKEILTFVNVRAYTSQTLAAPDNEQAKKVDFKIVAINSK